MSKNSSFPDSPRTIYKVLWQCARLLAFPSIVNIVMNIFTIVVNIALAGSLGEFADAVFSMNLSTLSHSGMRLGIYFSMIVLLLPLLGLASDFVMLKSALRHDNVVCGHYLAQNFEAVKFRKSGEIQHQLENAPNDLRIQWVNLISCTVAFFPCMVLLLFYSLHISWSLTLIMLILSSLRLLIPWFFKKKLAQFDEQEHQYYSYQRECEADITICPSIVKHWGIHGGVIQRVKDVFFEYYLSKAKRQVFVRQLLGQMCEFAELLATVLLLLCGAVAVAQQQISLGNISTLFVYFNTINILWGWLGQVIQNAPLMINSAKRTATFYVNEEKDVGEGISLFERLKLEDVGYNYGEKEVLKGCCFSVSKGEKVAIVGENGCGKSTLLKILSTLLTSYTGSIFINNIDLRECNLKEWRKLFAYAPQSPYVFEASVEENIVFDRIVDKSVLQSFIKAFGLEKLSCKTIDSTYACSGGERQKISLIRTLCSNKEVILLDEPTNHLDEQSINVLKKILHSTTKTIILVSHDAEMIACMDRVIVL